MTAIRTLLSTVSILWFTRKWLIDLQSRENVTSISVTIFFDLTDNIDQNWGAFDNF